MRPTPSHRHCSPTGNALTREALTPPLCLPGRARGPQAEVQQGGGHLELWGVPVRSPVRCAVPLPPTPPTLTHSHPLSPTPTHSQAEGQPTAPHACTPPTGPSGAAQCTCLPAHEHCSRPACTLLLPPQGLVNPSGRASALLSFFGHTYHRKGPQEPNHREALSFRAGGTLRL